MYSKFPFMMSGGPHDFPMQKSGSADQLELERQVTIGDLPLAIVYPGRHLYLSVVPTTQGSCGNAAGSAKTNRGGCEQSSQAAGSASSSAHSQRSIMAGAAERCAVQRNGPFRTLVTAVARFGGRVPAVEGKGTLALPSPAGRWFPRRCRFLLSRYEMTPLNTREKARCWGSGLPLESSLC